MELSGQLHTQASLVYLTVVTVPVWVLGRRDKYFVPVKNRNPDRLTRSLVFMISRFHRHFNTKFLNGAANWMYLIDSFNSELVFSTCNFIDSFIYSYFSYCMLNVIKFVDNWTLTMNFMKRLKTLITCLLKTR